MVLGIENTPYADSSTTHHASAKREAWKPVAEAQAVWTSNGDVPGVGVGEPIKRQKSSLITKQRGYSLFHVFLLAFWQSKQHANVKSKSQNSDAN